MRSGVAISVLEIVFGSATGPRQVGCLHTVTGANLTRRRRSVIFANPRGLLSRNPAQEQRLKEAVIQREFQNNLIAPN